MKYFEVFTQKSFSLMNWYEYIPFSFRFFMRISKRLKRVTYSSGLSLSWQFVEFQKQFEHKKYFSRGFSWGWRLAIFACHWATNDMKVARHKSIIIHFFLSGIIFREKMVSLSNNDRFDNYEIFFRNIWHFSVLARISYASIFFLS